MARFDLTDFEWSAIQPSLPNKPRGMARVDDRRQCLVAEAHNVGWVHGRGSHCTFRAPEGEKLTVPAKHPIKPVYVRQFVDLIDTL